MAYEFTDANFKSDVIESGKVTVVDLWAEWCQPCLAMGPIVDQLADEYKGRAVVGKLNVDNNQEVPMQYNVRGIPTFLIFKNGELIDKLVGTQPKKVLQDKIESLLA
jgi:thioredoxin 1